MSDSPINNLAAVELLGVSRRFGTQYVLKDLSLRMSQGKVLVLLGNNGSGKTTLLKILATKLRPHKGVAKVFGFDLLKETAEVRKHVAYVSVLGGHYGSLTAFENLRLSASLYGHDKNEVTVAELEGKLEAVGLLYARDKEVRTFSSGMKKRLAIARLLMSDADLWLLDEPYAALDDNGKQLIDDLITEGKAQGRTLIVATHNLERSAPFADSILKIDAATLQKYEAPSV